MKNHHFPMVSMEFLDSQLGHFQWQALFVYRRIDPKLDLAIENEQS